jgi:hypothetical protein
MATQSLFGGSMSPQEMQAQMLEQRAAQFAQMTPDQQLGMMAYKAGSGVGTGLAGAFGVQTQDPMIQRATKLRELASQYNTNTAAGIRQMADALRTTDPEMALQLSQKAAAMDLEAAKLTSEQALATQRGREREGADPLQQLIRTGKYTPASVSKYAKSGEVSDLDTIDKADPTAISETADGVFLINKLTGAKISRIGSAPERATKNIVNVDAKGEAEFVKELGKIDAKKVGDAGVVRDTAIASLNSLNKLASLPNQDLISGQFAEGRVGATNLLATLGLASPSDVNKLATSQQYQKVAGDVVLQTLGGKLGSGFSNADREFIAGLVPQLETNPEARRKLIKFMQRKNQDIIEEAGKLEAYARKNKGLSGYTPTIPMAVAPTGPYSGLSDAELAARIKRAQAAQR